MARGWRSERRDRAQVGSDNYIYGVNGGKLLSVSNADESVDET